MDTIDLEPSGHIYHIYNIVSKSIVYTILLRNAYYYLEVLFKLGVLPC